MPVDVVYNDAGFPVAVKTPVQLHLRRRILNLVGLFVLSVIATIGIWELGCAVPIPPPPPAPSIDAEMWYLCVVVNVQSNIWHQILMEFCQKNGCVIKVGDVSGIDDRECPEGKWCS